MIRELNENSVQMCTTQLFFIALSTLYAARYCHCQLLQTVNRSCTDAADRRGQRSAGMAAKRKTPDTAAAPSKKQRHSKNDVKPARHGTAAPKKLTKGKVAGATSKQPEADQVNHKQPDAKRSAIKLTKCVVASRPPATNLDFLPNTRKERKALKAKRMAEKKKHYTLGQQLVGHWETIRQHNVPKEKRAALVTTVLEQSKGNIAELAASHVTSRVLQACAKYGTGEQRASMLAEVLPQFVFLAKTQYGHYMLRKLVATAPRATVPGAHDGRLSVGTPRNTTPRVHMHMLVDDVEIALSFQAHARCGHQTY